ncbi:Ig-like domain-containing protein [Pseudomonas sp. LB3P14]
MTIQLFDQVLPADSEVALHAPQLPDSNRSVSGVDCGIAKEFYDLKPRGATVIIPPYLGQGPNQTVSLNLNGVQRIASEQTESHNTPTTLYIPHNRLRSDPGYINQLTYTAKRIDSPEETYQPPYTIRYHTIRPGMEDKIPGDEGHSELELILPRNVIEDGIDADRAAQGVQVYFSYPYCRAYDRILLNCNGHDVYRDVHPDEAPATPTSVPTSIGLMLDKTVFEDAGDHPQFLFSFSPRDQIGNGADPTSPSSKPISVVVDLKGTRLAAADIAEDPDDPDDAPDTIDLNKLGSKDLTIQVHVLEPVWASNDIVRVTYTATPSVGGIVEHVVDATVVRLPFTHRLLIPNAKVIADSAVKVTYEQVRGAAVTARSKIARARVIVNPVITSVKNSFGVEMENGGTVSDNKVTLSGSALAGTVLQIVDGLKFIEEVQTGLNYKWQSTWIPIAVGQRRFTVKEKSGNQFESEPWSLERLAFSIDRTQMKLNGFSVKIPQWQKTGEDSVGNTGVRVPTGGVPPYDFASSDPLTAPVTAQGKVTGLKNGVATIYVTDQEGTTLSYLAVVTNIFNLQISTEKLRSDDAIEWMNSIGGQHVYNHSFTRDIARVYTPLIPEPVNTCNLNGRFYTYMKTDLTFFGTQGRQVLTAWCLISI